MAVSKSLRMEVLRRDNHTCRYCGATAPDVKLTIDHVVPTTLGGSDDPTNLVAACVDCNAGKSSTPPDAPLVADVAQDALRWATAMRNALAKRVDDIDAENAYLEEFRARWDGWHDTRTGELVALPSDWERTIIHWYGLGLPLEILGDAVDKAMRKRGLRGYDPEFRYMAGIVWATLREAQEAASASLSEVPTMKDLHRCTEGAECSSHGFDARPCPWCSEIGCSWWCAFSTAAFHAAERERERNRPFLAATAQYQALTAVCDDRVIATFTGGAADA